MFEKLEYQMLHISKNFNNRPIMKVNEYFNGFSPDIEISWIRFLEDSQEIYAVLAPICSS
jgi:hypothetical protein